MSNTRITIENFKGVGERVEVDLKPITILFGANSAGKSTILQAMLYLRELLERRNADADRLLTSGTSIDLGGFRQFVHCHDLNREVKIGVTVEVGGDGLPVLPVVEWGRDEDEVLRSFSENGTTEVRTVRVEVGVGWNAETSSPQIRSYSVYLDEDRFATMKAESEHQCYLVECIADHPTFVGEFLTSPEQDYYPAECEYLQGYIDSKNLGLEEDRLKGVYRVPVQSKSVVPDWNNLILPQPPFFNKPEPEDDGFEEFQQYRYSQLVLSQLLVGSGRTVLDELQKIRYVGPLRTLPERNFSALRSPSEERWADGIAAWDRLYQSASSPDGNGLINEVSTFLSEEKRLNMGYSLSPSHVYEIDRDGFALAALKLLAEGAEDVEVEERIKVILKDILESPEKVSVQLKDLENQSLVAPNDIGVGVSQVVPVIVAALTPGASATAIEQPELHLHPAIQARMGDLFIESALKEGVENRFILESHSEHLILRLLRRIRECHEEGVDYPDHLPKIKPEDLSVYYIQSEEGHTSMTNLRVSDDGDFLDRWPNGFFDERAGELF